MSVNSQSASIAPEQFQIIVIPVFAVEDMYDDVDIIKQYPSGLFIAGSAETLQVMLSRRVADLVGNGLHLAFTRAGSDNKIVGGGRFTLQIKSYNVGATQLFCQCCR